MIPPMPPVVWTAPPRGSVLVLAPHPDDESLGCGGAIALHAAQGDPVHIIVVTDGAAGDPEGYYKEVDYVALRRWEACQAAEILGVKASEFWGYPDGRLAEALDLEGRLLNTLEAIRPATLYGPSVLEIHPDHWALAVAVEQVLARYQRQISAYSYEIWAAVQPTHVLDISGVWEVKRKAIEQYATQLRYHDYRPKAAGLNAYRSIYSPAARFVEAFEARRLP